MITELHDQLQSEVEPIVSGMGFSLVELRHSRSKTQNHINNTLNPSLNSMMELRDMVHLTQDLIQTLEPAGRTSRSPQFLQITSLLQNELPDLNRQIRELSVDWNQRDREMYEMLYAYLSDSLIANPHLV